MRRSAKFNRWQARVERWRKKYKVATQPPPPVPRYCAKCLTSKRLQRHHKGHEYYFACVKEEWYAAQYLRFDSIDVTDLCDKHHRYLHSRYESVLVECNAYLLACRPVRQSDDTVRYTFEPSFEVLESYRQRLIHICNKFLERKSARPHGKQGGNHTPRRP